MIKLNPYNRPYIICSLLVVALLLSVSAHPVQGRDEIQDRVDFYVAVYGDDGGPGTQSLPWRTVQFAADQVGPGDTIYVRAGTYNESVALNQAGVEGSPITLTVYGDEAVTINGGEAPAITALTSQWDGTQYWIIEGFTLDSNAEYTVQLSMWNAFSSNHMITRNNYIIGAVIVSGSYNLFEGNEVDGSQHKGNEDGVQEFEEISHHNVYRNNHIHHFNNRGIWSMNRTHDSTFENNYIHHIENGNGYEQGISLDGFGNVLWRHIVRGNHVHDIGNLTIELENCFACNVENNIVHDSHTGIGIINYGGEVGAGWGTDKRCADGGENNQYGDTDGDNDCRGDLTGNIIRQNLIYDMSYNAGIVVYYAGGIKIMSNTITNINGSCISLFNGHYTPMIQMQSNIISQCADSGVYADNFDSIIKDSNNLINQPEWKASYWINGKGYSISEYQSLTGKGQGSLDEDPNFISPQAKNFRLLSNSPAIDAGIDNGLSADLDGINRPLGLGYDLGVYEHGGYDKLIHLPMVIK